MMPTLPAGGPAGPVVLGLAAVAVLVAVAAVAVAVWAWWRLLTLRDALQRSRHAATHDGLTGLANRAGLAECWPRYAASGRPVVLVLDLDGFKPVNDTHGHAAGDAVLTAVAARLQQVAPGVVARLGGDEFAVLLTHPDPARVAGTLARAVAAPVRLPGGVSVSVSASIGLAPAGGGLAHALACADAAMYRAKVTGDPVAVYNPHADDRPDPASHTRPGLRVRDLPATVPGPVVPAQTPAGAA